MLFYTIQLVLVACNEYFTYKTNDLKPFLKLINYYIILCKRVCWGMLLDIELELFCYSVTTYPTLYLLM